MKSQFLQKLSNILIPDKETDYVDFYNLQSLKSWPLFTIVQYDSEKIDDFIVAEKVEDKSKYKESDIDFLGLEYCEIISFDESKLILDAGGEFQGLHRLIITLDEFDEVIVASCNIVPELSENLEILIQRHSEEEYSVLLDSLQETLENQN